MIIIYFCIKHTFQNVPLPNININLTHKTLYKKVKLLNLNNINFNKLNSSLSRENWESVLSSPVPESATKIILDIYKKYIEESTSVRSISLNIKKIKPWITRGIVQSIKQIDKLKKQLLHKFDTALHNNYINFRNTLKKIINKTKKEYYRGEIDKNLGNTRKMYRTINEATSGSRYRYRSTNNRIEIKIMKNFGMTKRWQPSVMSILYRWVKKWLRIFSVLCIGLVWDFPTKNLCS